MTDWKDWKVGDRLQCKKNTGGCNPGDIVTVKFNGLSSAYKGLLLFIHSDGWDGGIADYGQHDNPSSYFFFLPATPQYTKGDRVRRTSEPGGVPMGTIGTVESVQGDTLHVLWDNGRADTYGPALYHFLEPYLDTTPKPVLACERCNESNQWAEANQPNGAYRCFQCRRDRFR